VPHAVLAPVIEKQYAHLHAAERTKVLIALMDKYSPGESTGSVEGERARDRAKWGVGIFADTGCRSHANRVMEARK
jgi:hypothetical protein